MLYFHVSDPLSVVVYMRVLSSPYPLGYYHGRHCHLPFGPARVTNLFISAVYILVFFAILQTAQAQQPAPITAPSIALAGSMGNKAIVVFGNEASRSMSVGQTYQGVKLLSLQGDKATFEVQASDGSTRRISVAVGQMPISLTSSSSTSSSSNNDTIVLSRGQGGHFYASGYINNKSAQFMVDTGATAIAMSRADALRLGINLNEGKPAMLNTANGSIIGVNVTLSSVRVQNVVVQNIEAVVTEQPMEHILLGNSFLQRFDITINHHQMVLKKRY